MKLPIMGKSRESVRVRRSSRSESRSSSEESREERDGGAWDGSEDV